MLLEYDVFFNEYQECISAIELHVSGLHLFEQSSENELKAWDLLPVLSYEGIAFQYMAPSVFEDSQFEYVQNYLRIISTFYGVLKPRDGVTPYRLEMQAKVGIGETKNLYIC